jgi:hypothetical protein
MGRRELAIEAGLVVRRHNASDRRLVLAPIVEQVLRDRR